MSRRSWATVLTTLAISGCSFHVAGTNPTADLAVPGDGAIPPDVAVPGDLAGVDLAHNVDLLRRIPDGAVPGFPGYPCDSPADCKNEFCVNGYCCDTSCDANNPLNVCRACNVYGEEGHCSFLPAGVPSQNGHCAVTSSTSCGTDGLCDGAGNCADWPLATLCAPPMCDLTTLSAPSSCDGQGHCQVDSVSADCGSYVCAPMSCQPGCTSAADCAPGKSCTNGLCDGKRPLGLKCSNNGDCDSGHCAQGLCCASACTGNCVSCAQGLAPGLCLPVADGSDPFNQCAATASSSCGLDGACNGQGACRDWAAGTPCGGRTCDGDATLSPSSCNGAGQCVPGLGSSCGNYSCNPSTGSCYASPCTGDSSCATGHHCTNGSCQ